ncbi:DUF1353 domain-containing protein [Tenacibaculum sp. C7A-26P2]|uniref:DUF1353 domain-containing protein n=1 Tax=Tenacibaculum sp. C7A-26P2 TaxID=3447504 RepID=UPI003F84DA94
MEAIKIKYLENPVSISLAYLPTGKGERTFETTQDISVILSDGYELHIPKGFKTDLSSVPSWAWSIFKPIDKAFIGDLIHDALWVDKAGQVNHFNNSFYDARKFADEERLRWRKVLAPKKKIKNYLTHYVIRLIGGFMYSKQLKIPN